MSNENKHLSYKQQLIKDRYIDSKTQQPVQNMIYKDVLPFICIIGPSNTGKQHLYEQIIYKITKIKPNNSLTTIATKNNKFTIFKCSNSINSFIDASKIMDLLILTVNSEYFEMEIFEILSLAKAHGFCKVIVAIKFKDNADKKRKFHFIKKRIWKEITGGIPVIDIQEIDKIVRMIKNSKCRPISFRCNNSFIVADKIICDNSEYNMESIRDPSLSKKTNLQEGMIEKITTDSNSKNYIIKENFLSKNKLEKNEKKSDESAISKKFCYDLFGYVRGCPFDCNMIHIPGKGDFQIETIQKIDDPCISEKKLLDKEKIIFYSPQFYTNKYFTDQKNQSCQEIKMSNNKKNSEITDIKNLGNQPLDTKNKSNVDENNLRNDFPPIKSFTNDEKHCTNSFNKFNETPYAQIQKFQSNNYEVSYKKCDDFFIFGDETVSSGKIDMNTNNIDNPPEIVAFSDKLDISLSLNDKIHQKNVSNFITVDNQQMIPSKIDETKENNTKYNSISEKLLINDLPINGMTSKKQKIKDLKVKLKSYFEKKVKTIQGYKEKFEKNNITENILNEKEKRIIQEKMNVFENKKTNSKEILPGDYVKISINSSVKLNFDNLTILGSIKNLNSLILQGKIKKHNYYEGLIKSNERVLVSIGWRRDYINIIFSFKDVTRNRFLKYILEGMHCNANFISNIVTPGTPFCIIKEIKYHRSFEHENKNFSILKQKGSNYLCEPEYNCNNDTCDLSWDDVKNNLVDYRKKIDSITEYECSEKNKNCELKTEYSESEDKKIVKDSEISSESDLQEYSNSNTLFVKNKKEKLPLQTKSTYVPTMEHFRIAAIGSITDVTGQTNLVKKLKLIGYPYKINENTAFIKDMFTSEKEATKFEGALIKTVSGIRGCIKKAREDGSFRATFEGRIKMSDIVFLKCFVPYEVIEKYDLSNNNNDFAHRSINSSLLNVDSVTPYAKNHDDNQSFALNDAKIYPKSSHNTGKERYIQIPVADKIENAKNLKLIDKNEKLKSNLTLDKRKIKEKKVNIQFPINPEKTDHIKIKNNIIECRNLIDFDAIKQQKNILRVKEKELKEQAILRNRGLKKSINISIHEKELKGFKRKSRKKILKHNKHKKSA
ncbi:hypothetical protein EDEG_00568 [Edhazardia aedis USNM 41457]|uniref:Ribosome biogenesis protein BMS1/TSR1 C-terminal domain-containing protein n=1 Tax=Edhazardia aedis (strain USNM 41457) TaxID=1003232 RepID=J8ZNF3_EDHAE|nr:hypothetical protein EDEG_00568 [Edhazardia aedis USNM 41457]|eukprot:EJW01208.1 hypothetical protein EDEG_00568 [Edhazardia aedis USNM 41457]